MQISVPDSTSQFWIRGRHDGGIVTEGVERRRYLQRWIAAQQRVYFLKNHLWLRGRYSRCQLTDLRLHFVFFEISRFCRESLNSCVSYGVRLEQNHRANAPHFELNCGIAGARKVVGNQRDVHNF